MRWSIPVIVVLLSACWTSGGGTSPVDGGVIGHNCPATASGPPEACIQDTVCSYPGTPRDNLCTCTSTGWRCNSCPGDFMFPGATCTPGDACDYEDWEHGCSCGCNASGHWACANETIGSHCPTGEIDAGVN